MTTASPLPTYPDDEIPLTDRHWRERWAAELTRANRVERERDEARAALTISRKTVDDLTAHSAAQGAYITRLDIDVRVRDKALFEAERKFNRMHDRADKLAEWIAQQMVDCDYTTEDMRELIEAAGVECSECEGRGWVADEEMIGDPGTAYGYRTRNVADECGKCDGIGRVLR